METWNTSARERIASFKLRLEQIESRITQRANALLDQLLVQKEYAEQKHSLLLGRVSIMEEMACAASNQTTPDDRDRSFERMKNVALVHEMANDDGKRQLTTLKISNRTESRNGIAVEPFPWTEEASFGHAVSGGDPHHATL